MGPAVSVDLSAEQRRAVERSGQDVCVVAGPGSGKTRVLVERFAWLVEARRVDPLRILAITFTEKAARVMKGRLVDRFAAQPQIREKVERAWVMTIDAFCARLLGEHAIEAALAPDFRVLEEAAADRMRREAAETALDELFEEQPEAMRRLMEALALSTSDDNRQVDLAESLIAVHEAMRLAGVRELPDAAAPPDVRKRAHQLAAEIGQAAAWSNLHAWVREFLALPEGPPSRRHFEVTARFKANLQGRKPGVEKVKELREQALPALEAAWIVEWNAGLPELLRTAVARLDQRYRDAKRRQAAVDFAELGERTIELLASDAELRRTIRARFEHILMDELQDTNRLQWRLVELLRRPEGFFAVGDINQSIYGFRHADRTVFREYREELRGKGHAVDELKENYRSRVEILRAVETALKDAPGVEERELVAMRGADRAEGPCVEVWAGEGDQAREQEARLVIARMTDWRNAEARPWGDFAILVRTLKAAEPFEELLEKRGIPFVVSGGRTFLEARETRDVMGLLAGLVNPLDEIATAGVLRGPLVGWSDGQLLRAGAQGRLKKFEELFGRARRLAGFVAPDRMLAAILDECGYLARLSDRGRANIDKLLAWVRREHAARPRPLAELLDDLESLRDAEAEPEAPPQQVSDAVNIMTIHAAKGLEFPVVFVAALSRGGRKSSPVFLFSKELGLGAKWRNPATGKGLKDAVHELLSAKLRQVEKEEEERLLYVAMTRAEQRLVLSFARQRNSGDLVKRAERVAAARAEQAAPDAGAVEPPVTAGVRDETVLGAPRVTAHYDSSAAVTDIALFAACPRKYFLARYVGAQPEMEGPGTGAVDFGIEVHKAMAGLETNSAEALELKRMFEATHLGERLARASRVEREFDFMLAVDDVILSGKIDVWFEERGELVVLDYKTDREEQAAEGYSLQLGLYALALERYAGRIPDRAALCYLRTGRVVEVSLSREELEKARGVVRELAAAQDSLQFPLKVGEQCRRCWFLGGLCPAKLEEGS